MLAEDTMCTSAPYLSTSRGEDYPEHWAKIYHILVLWGNLRSAVIWITDREKGGEFQLGDTCLKTGQTVLEVIRPNHPKAYPLTASILESYGGKPTAMVPMDITDTTVATVARRLLGSAGPWGVYLVILQHWLMRFGVSRMGHRQVIG